MRVLRLAPVLLLALGCGDDATTAPDATPTELGPHPALAIPCEDSLDDLHTLLPGMPPMDDSRRGDVFRCVKAEVLNVAKLNEQIDGYNEGFENTARGDARSGLWAYRIAYRSTRNTVAGNRAEGDMAAYLLIPHNPRPGAPLVVFGHGSSGIAPGCAPTRFDLAGPILPQDAPPSLLRLAGYGFTVIAPDYAGYFEGQAPSYFNAEDAAHAILDATRAAAKVLPSPLEKVAFAGVSQGGHAVISAHSYAKSYGMEGTLIGVATLAPMWSSMSLWAAAVTPLAGLTTANDRNSVLYAMSYAYSAGELRDGPGGGLAVFQQSKRQTVLEALLGGACYNHPKLMELGATPADFFDPVYVNAVATACAVNPGTPDCTHAEAQKWMQRWVEDRPPIDPAGPPILMINGGLDASVPPARAQCARDKFLRDLGPSGTTNIRYCYSPRARHRDIMRGPDSDYLNRWIAFQTGNYLDPGMCQAPPAGVGCEVPPNDY